MPRAASERYFRGSDDLIHATIIEIQAPSESLAAAGHGVARRFRRRCYGPSACRHPRQRQQDRKRVQRRTARPIIQPSELGIRVYRDCSYATIRRTTCEWPQPRAPRVSPLFATLGQAGRWAREHSSAVRSCPSCSITHTACAPRGVRAVLRPDGPTVAEFNLFTRQPPTACQSPDRLQACASHPTWLNLQRPPLTSERSSKTTGSR